MGVINLPSTLFIHVMYQGCKVINLCCFKLFIGQQTNTFMCTSNCIHKNCFPVSKSQY